MRCLTDDLHIPPPPLRVPLSELEHVLLREARRLAPAAPQGQKRILELADLMVFRIRHSRWRGATWVEERLDCLWVLAAAEREDGSLDDAYGYFGWLHERGTLLPAAPDGLRLQAEAVAAAKRQMEQAVGRLCEEIEEAARAGRPAALRVELPGPAGVLPCRVRVIPGDPAEVWVALSVLYVAGNGCPSEFRDLVWATFERELDPADWEWRPDFPGGDLSYHERVRLYLA